MHNYYIDDDLLKHQRALHHIYRNYDPNIFNHNSDKYQQTQKLNESRVMEANI